jgi:O-acetyl-ADP-ribose deacetylase (regulator of RNase III)
MPCKIVHGSIFDSKMQTLVNPVNCVGVMGAGLPKEFKRRYPEMMSTYQEICNTGRLTLGRPYLFISLSMSHRIVLFPTKNHWKYNSHAPDIIEGIQFLRRNYAGMEITSLAVPALGCGLGGLEWSAFWPDLLNEFDKFPIPVELYAPSSA